MDRGVDGEHLPDGAVVIRMCQVNLSLINSPKQNGSGALASAFTNEFELSSEDRKQNPPYLSVYEESLTTPQQAQHLTGGNKNLALRLPVNSIRSLRNPNNIDYRLGVCWFLALIFQGNQFIQDHRTGSEGHCGITGLLRPIAMPRKYWKWFRVKLADIAIENGTINIQNE